jgi:signal transduction histidine kinase
LIRARRDQLAGAVKEKTALLKQEIVERARVEREVIDICAREQRRIAYDLHDNLGQQLVGIALRAKLLAEKLRPVRPGEAKEISEIVRLTNEAAKQNRLTARNLDGPDGVGDLKTALQRLAADLRRNCRVNSRVKTDSRSLPVSTPVAVQLYRIAQEAVHNAVEHGDAKEVQIDLASDDKEIVLRVHDNGRGFRARAAAKGLGLRIMRYRAHCIGGSCEVQSTRATGTTVTCRVPSPSGSGVN